MSDYLPLIIGLEGTSLTSNESNFLINYKPWGIILFQRNCVNHKTTLNLINDIKAKTHQNIPILIDQEGGRVSRLNYREFPKTLSAKSFGDLYEYNKEKALEAVKLNTNLVAGSLKQMGININTVPVLDMPSLTESGVIGDRAYSSNKKIITEIAKIVLDTNSTNGIASVIKHIPGHGCSTIDSHKKMPRIMVSYALDGRETIALRGYPNQSLSGNDGSVIYNKFSLELRYPITLKPSASIYALTFLEAGDGYNSFREFDPFNSKRSAGAGVRIFMPAFGLLGIDFGYGFDNANPNINTPNGWETHFIIGQRF